MVLDEFLAAEEWRGLLDVVVDRAADFQPTITISSDGEERVDSDFRRSVVLGDLGRIRDLFVERLAAFAAPVFWRLQYPSFPVAHYEIELTGTGDGDYFRTHTDSGPGMTATRAITFIYFFHAEPRPFTGGELVIHGDAADGQPSTRSIDPAQNQIVFFPSETPNEIRPVHSPSGAFHDSLFTVNGWLHR